MLRAMSTPLQPTLPGLESALGLPSPTTAGVVPTTMAALAGRTAGSDADRRTYLAGVGGGGWLQQRWGSNLTPSVLTAVQRAADMGVMTQYQDLLDELRATDPHLHAVLGKREWTVAGADWEVRPAAVYEAAEPDSAKEVRRFCTNVLRAIPNLSDHFAHLMGAVYHGRAAVEVLWESADGYAWPTALLPIHPRMLHYGPDSHLHLYADPNNASPRPAFGVWPGLRVNSAPSGKFIVHAPRIRGGFQVQEGLGRPVSWYCMFKRWVARDAMGLAEMGGRLARIGTFQTGVNGGARASKQDVADLETALQNWTSSTALVHPDTTKVQLVPPTSGDSIHGWLFEAWNGEISKAVLGETLTTDAGSKGARSLGEVHAQQGRMIAKYDANALAETVRRYLLAPLVRFNFGDSEPVPRLAFSVEPQESLDGLAKRLESLVKIGLKVPASWVRDQFGIADPQPGEELLGASVPLVTPSVANDSVPSTDV